jgi:hypothetical protein
MVDNMVNKVEHSKPSVVAKLTLPSAWFQIREIHGNCRNKDAVSFVGSLVAVTQEVDEDNLDKCDYIRAHIMVLDISKVPAVAPGVFGKCLCDFHFKRKLIRLNMKTF